MTINIIDSAINENALELFEIVLLPFAFEIGDRKIRRKINNCIA